MTGLLYYRLTDSFSQTARQALESTFCAALIKVHRVCDLTLQKITESKSFPAGAKRLFNMANAQVVRQLLIIEKGISETSSCNTVDATCGKWAQGWELERSWQERLFSSPNTDAKLIEPRQTQAGEGETSTMISWSQGRFKGLRYI